MTIQNLLSSEKKEFEKKWEEGFLPDQNGSPKKDLQNWLTSHDQRIIEAFAKEVLEKVGGESQMGCIYGEASKEIKEAFESGYKFGEKYKISRLKSLLTPFISKEK